MDGRVAAVRMEERGTESTQLPRGVLGLVGALHKRVPQPQNLSVPLGAKCYLLLVGLGELIHPHHPQHPRNGKGK